MFENVGGKIKLLAKIVCWVGIAVSVLSGTVLLFDSFFAGLITAIFGVLGSWIGALFLHGFGELIDNTASIKRGLGFEDASVEENAEPKYNAEAEYKCPECQAKFKFGQTVCPGCGKKVNWK